MTTPTQESAATVPSQMVEKIRDDLLNGGESEAYNTHSQPEAHSRQQHFSECDVDTDDTPRSLPATVPESVEPYLSSKATPPRAKVTTRSSTVRSAPADMELLVQSTPSQDAKKAASFHRNTHLSEGDTQPMPSQIYHQERESMLRRSMAAAGVDTPVKPPVIVDTEPPTAQSVRSLMAATPHTLQQDQSGYVDLAAGYRDLSPVQSIPGEGAFDELLKDPSSPQTQFQMPDKPNVPQTPVLAGQKHGRDGEPLTSITTTRTTTTNCGLSQAFGQQKAELMDRSQLFAQTQAASSPVAEVPRSDPIQSRPSPDLGERDISSPLVHFNSSPAYTKKAPFVSVLVEPRSRYRTMADEFQDLTNARTLSQQLEPADEDDIFEDDSYQERLRVRGIRRTLSDQAMLSAARVKAPARPGSRQFLKASSRPGNNRIQREAIGIVTAGTAVRQLRKNDDDFLEIDGEENALDDEKHDNQLERRALENAYDGEGAHVDSNETNDEDQGDDKADEYDELNQELRSQPNDLDNYDDNRSIAESVDQKDVEMQVYEHQAEDVASEHADPSHRTHRSEDQSTQRSTIADSQPAAGGFNYQQTLAPIQRSSLASFVPGSQYAGKTSEEQAFLASSQRRLQGKVAASHLDSADLDKPTSSPPLHTTIDTLLGNSATWHTFCKQFNPYSSPFREESSAQEIPESDAMVAEPEDPHGKDSKAVRGDEDIQESNVISPYSTGRTHVSRPIQSTDRSILGYSPIKPFTSPQSRLAEMSPRKAAGVRRFADMATDLTPSSGSFEAAEVDDIMEAVMTVEDREVVQIAQTSLKPPRSKRPRPTREVSLQPKAPPSKPFIETGRTYAPAEDTTTKAIDTMVVRESSFAACEESPQALRDSPSKGNELAHPPIEKDKSHCSALDDTQTREMSGADAVSQLIAARPTARSRKVKSIKCGHRSGMKSARARKTSVVQKSARARLTGSLVDTNDDEDVELDMPESGVHAEEDPSMVAVQDAIPNADAEIFKTSVANQNAMLKAQQRNPTDGSDVDGFDNPVVAPERIFALFKGTYHNFYPATWLGGSTDNMTYRVRFDDTTVTNIETFHVSRLDIRIGDLVKVDVAGLKTKTWRVVGFASPVQSAEERRLGVDIRGHSRLKVQARVTRSSLSKDASFRAKQYEGAVEEVSISQVYLTKTMWPSFQARTFTQPSKERDNLYRADTPSTRLGTPSIESLSPRSRRATISTATTKAHNSRILHLRDTSTASSTSSGRGAIFSGMAFAISYVTSEEQRSEITKLIQRNGGTILDDGFEELFELPNITESSNSPSISRYPAKEDDVQPKGQELRLKAEYKDLTFVALIADRHSRRAKYMQALALSLPTLSGRWIKDSLDTTKNTSLVDGEVSPLSWDRYLLPAGESSYLGGAIRSRTLVPYDTKSSDLKTIFCSRPLLLNGGSVLIVAPKKSKISWDKRKTYAFLTLALGAGQVKRVNDLQEAKAVIRDEHEMAMWIYVDGELSEACTTLLDNAPAGKKRRRDGEAIGKIDGHMSATHGNVRIVNDEFVIQSLILGGLAE